MIPAILLTTLLLSQAPHVELDFNSMSSGEWKGKRFNEIVPARTIVRVVRVTESGFARDADRSGEQADYDVLLASLDCLKPLGLMVSLGNASGEIPAFDIGILSQKGSLYLSRPTLATYTATRADLEATAREVFDVIRSGKVKVEIRHTYRLAEAVQVHRDPEGRKTVGSIVMVP
jgi:NADPH:quinone reductase-like Zn-dependent oxidoreductase